MKINVISVNNGHSLTEDCQTLSYTLKKLYRKKYSLQLLSIPRNNCFCGRC